ncbi:uncharacterized protein LOC143519339 isoform X2 [Brachyhypopomus gauderio]|uniref:uncharacterized protein LOC143519339 isoform X2 n=1 Tax=Brachyhypopomus gauderio TaxID=698409 RepID=UPI004042735F
MDRKMPNLARAKKKLRYFRAEEKSPCSLNIKDVLTLNDIDRFFDDLDECESSSPELQPPSPFIIEGQKVLASENDIQDDHLNDEGIAPIKTSSPIDKAAAGSGAGDAGQPDPLLFSGENEEPLEGDLQLPAPTQRPSSPKKILQGDSVFLESPPARLEFTKPSNLDDVSVPRCTTLKTLTQPDLESQTPAPETQEELQIDRSPSPPLAAVLQGSPAPLPQEQRKDQAQELEVDAAIKNSSFQQKLRNALQPKTTCFRKQQSQKQPVRAASPVQLDDDFMILEDNAPVLFTIPRKLESSQRGKTAPETPKAKPTAVSGAPKAKPTDVSGAPKAKPTDVSGAPKAKLTKVAEAEQAALKPTEDESYKNEPLNKLKTTVKKGVQTCIEETDGENEAALGENVVSLGASEEVALCEQISANIQTNQEADLPYADKQKARIKTKPNWSENKNAEHDVPAKSPRQRSSSKRRRSAILSPPTNSRRARKCSGKTKPTPARPTIKISGTAKPRNQGRKQTAAQKSLSEEQEEEPAHHDELASSTTQPQQHCTTAAGKKATKQPVTKRAASERSPKVRKVNAKVDSRRKECTVPDGDLSAEGPVTGRRKRKPPGEWWVSVQSESLTQEQEEVLHRSVPQEKKDEKSHKRRKRQEAPSSPADRARETFPRPVQESPREPDSSVPARKVAKGKGKGKKPPADELKCSSVAELKNPEMARGKRKPKSFTSSQQTLSIAPAPVIGEEVQDCAPLEQHSCSPLPQRSLTPGNIKMFDKIYTRENRCGSTQKRRPSPLRGPVTVSERRQRKAPGAWWEAPPPQRSPDSSPPPLKPIPQKDPHHGVSASSSRKARTAVHSLKRNKRNLSNTPKSVRRSLATFNSILASGKAESSRARGLERKGCRNLLHSLEEQSERSSDNAHSDNAHSDGQHASSNATFDVCVSGVTMEPVTNARLSARSRVSDHDIGFKSGPSSMIELGQYEEDEDADLPSSRVIPQKWHVPRVLADCDLCAPPLRPIVLEPEDWDNICAWLSHLWPAPSNNGLQISPADFHWHSYGGRGMGHTVDLQNNTFSNGKILLGSFMKKPAQVDLNAVTVFNVVSSCVRVEIDGIKAVYNSGQTFVTPCGKSYSIHNICREPAVLWYNRMLH